MSVAKHKPTPDAQHSFFTPQPMQIQCLHPLQEPCLRSPSLSSSHHHHHLTPTRQTSVLVDNSPTILRTRHLHRRPHRQSLPIIPKESRLGPTVTAQIKINICPILIRPRQPILRTQRISTRRTQIDHHHDDTRSSVGQWVARGIRFAGEFPACSTRGAGTSARSDAECVLGEGGTVARGGVEAAGCCVCVAVWTAEGVAAAVPGETGFVGYSYATGSGG